MQHNDVGNLYFNSAGTLGKLSAEQSDLAVDGNNNKSESKKYMSDFSDKEKFKQFIKDFKGRNDFVYRNQLKRHTNLGIYFLEIHLEHLSSFNDRLYSKLLNDPSHFLPIFEQAASEVLREGSAGDMNSITNGSVGNTMLDESRMIQVTFTTNAKPTPLRELNAQHISKLVVISGIVINCSRTSPKATKAWIQCTNCKTERKVPVKPGFSHIQMPKRCDSNASVDGKQCPPDSYIILPDKCTYVDQQSLKLQESPESVPTGEMPRNIILTAERNLVEKAPPGTRVNVIGIFSTFTSGSNGGKVSKQQASIRHPYVRVIGIQHTTHGTGRTEMSFTQEEEEKFIQFSKKPNLYELIAENIDAAIMGHEDIKKAITCQLFGGASKQLPDGIRRRGDINVLLLGDPSTAKSQLLKFVEKVAPIGVYTSGKGSSAAGLTACIIKEPGSGEYYLEGGSMVLADGGIVCIDEFDKMRQQDRVAIHEAMEQQTISIAKAGITTVLNSRTSVLAAANPIFGRYDDMKSAEEQIDFQTTILSRFDMIFIVKDTRDAKRDEKVAKHVIYLHMFNKAVNHKNQEEKVDTDFLKRYIAFARTRCSPRLVKSGAEILKNYYVNQRSARMNSQKQQFSSKLDKPKQSVIPITVRQLEALIRISESLARIVLSKEATNVHAKEAIRLFTSSTVDAINSGIISELTMNNELSAQIQKVEDEVKKKLPVGGLTNQDVLISLLERNGNKRYVVERAIFIMAQRGEIELRNQRKCIYRKK